jgi:hypothetical protein
VKRLLPRPLANLRQLVADDAAVLESLRRSPKTAYDLTLATSLDEGRVFAAVDGLVRGEWVRDVRGDRWTYSTTSKEPT